LTLHQALNGTAGFESLFAYGRGARVSDERAARFGIQAEVYVHGSLTRATGIQSCGTWLSTTRLARLIRRWRPDIVHLHNLHGYYLDLSITQTLGRLRLPVVWTLHDGWALTGRCAYLSECERWKVGCGHCPDLRRYPRTFLDTSALMWRRKRKYLTEGWSPLIVCPSHWLAGRVRESFLRGFRVRVVPNGIDVHVFLPGRKPSVRQKLGVAEDKKVLLFVAADLRNERKGVRYFIEALQAVAAEDWVALTVGNRIASLPARLRAIAREEPAAGYRTAWGGCAGRGFRIIRRGSTGCGGKRGSDRHAGGSTVGARASLYR
jgi:glycosyltransferase involved in cell wall biosynthesis